MAETWVSHLSCLTPSGVWAWANKSAALAWKLHFPEQYLALFTLSLACQASKFYQSSWHGFFWVVLWRHQKNHCACVCSDSFRPFLWKAMHNRTLNLLKELGKLLMRTVFRCIRFMTINEAIKDCSIICCARLLCCQIVVNISSRYSKAIKDPISVRAK